MKNKIHTLISRAMLALAVALLTPSAWTQTETILHAFAGGPTDGEFPGGSPILYSQGTLLGTTSEGGEGDGACCGTVYELSKGTNGQWTESIVYYFGSSNNDAEFPYGPLAADGKGNLYGTSTAGGSIFSFGAVFELSPAPNGTWTESVAYAFPGGADGAQPSNAIHVPRAVEDYAVAGLWEHVWRCVVRNVRLWDGL